MRPRLDGALERAVVTRRLDGMSVKELEDRETAVFLEWRQTLALQAEREGLLMIHILPVRQRKSRLLVYATPLFLALVCYYIYKYYIISYYNPEP